MGFFALALALIAQRFVVVAPDHSARAWLHALIDRLGRACDAGARREGVAAWLVLVGGCLALVVGMSWLASWAGSGATLLFHAAVVFFTIEVRALSPLSAMHVALAAGDRAQFQGLVQRWVAEPALPAGLPEPTLTEWCRRAITRALEVGHRQIFAPLFWYLILPGVTGPVLYRLAQLVAERWAGPAVPSALADVGPLPSSAPEALAEPGVDRRSPGFAAWAQKVYGWLDAVPVRVSAAGFAVVGNFEDAVYCWRAAVSLPGGALQRRVLQMVGGGALGVRLADPEVQAQLERQAAVLEGESGSGDLDGPGTFDWQGAQPDGPALRSAQGLLWRAVVWWIGVFLVLSAASGLGH